MVKNKQCPKICSCLGDFVQCSKLDLHIVPAELPAWTERLNLNNNHLESMKQDIWPFLKKLTKLTMNKNKIKILTKESFLHLEHLEVLELNRNHIENFDALTFQNLEKLKELKMRRNKISDLRDGAFFGLKRTKLLHLDFNTIQLITKGWMYGLDSLQDLSLSNNIITNIDKDAWEFSHNLIDLDLSYNRLRSIKSDTLRGLWNLKRLILNHNNISLIEEHAFTHLPNLKILEIIGNKISWTIEDASGIFLGLHNLTKFFIAANGINSVNKNAFLGLKHVTHLDLNGNNITSIQQDAFAEMPYLTHVVLNTTSLICDCNLKWFPEWLRRTKVSTHTYCAYPDSLKRKSLISLSPNNLTCDELPKPRLIEELPAEIMALKGGNISLSCRAMSSSPSPMVFHWKKDNVELTSANITLTQHQQVQTGVRNGDASAMLFIPLVQHSDAGRYQCVVSNDFGTTYSAKSIISVLIFPRFVKLPSNITAKSGSTARLECAAVGEPQPEVAWQKDGGDEFPAARERRMHVMPDEDVFFITNTKTSDTGVYSCTAHNAAGSIVHNATLTIEEPPYFAKPMDDKEVIHGESVVIQCKAGGAPKPIIRWLKDGVPINITQRHFFTAEEQVIIIIDTVKSDSGTYTCELENRLGNVTGSCHVVIQTEQISQRDRMGIIIITVVCCAVGTSIVWVVIIYQTRKRAPRNQLIQQQLKQRGGVNLPMRDSLTMLHHFKDNVEASGAGAAGFTTTSNTDNMSEHSSCKDSGTGDSAKRSNDDFMPALYLYHDMDIPSLEPVEPLPMEPLTLANVTLAMPSSSNSFPPPRVSPLTNTLRCVKVRYTAVPNDFEQGNNADLALAPAVSTNNENEAMINNDGEFPDPPDELLKEVNVVLNGDCNGVLSNGSVLV